MIFQRIGPASRGAQARAPLRLYRYPQEGDWRSLRPDPGLQQEMLEYLRTTTRGVLALVGPHGCGKTFHLLYLGHWWEAQNPPQALAFYAPAPATLSPSEALNQWRQTGEGRKCLWLIDDTHTDAEGIARQLVAEFEELALRGHWLVTAGWSAGGIEGAVILPWALTEDTVRLALQARGHEELATDEVVDALARSRLGLRQILWAARFRPDRLAQTDLLEQEWAAEMIGSLSQPAAERLATLARLKFLGLPFLPRTEAETQLLEEIARTTGFAQQLESRPGGFEIPDDDIAQLLLRRDIGEAGDSAEIARSFLFPLRRYISDLLTEQLLELPGRFLHALRLRTRGDLGDWIGNVPRDGELLTDFLIDDFLNDELLAEVRAAVIGHQALTDAVRLVATPRSRDAWARETAIAMLAAMTELPAALETDLSTWRALGTLAHLADDTTVRERVSRAAHADGIQNALRRTTGPERGNLLDTAALVGEDAYSAFLGLVRDSLVDEIQAVRPRGAWRRLATLAGREAAVAVELLESLISDVMDHLLFGAPSAARSFLAGLHPSHYRPERTRVAALFDRALRARKITDEDLEGWTGPRDLVSLVALARRQQQAMDVEPVIRQAREIVQATNPGILTDLCHDVSKFGRDSHLRRALAQTVLETLRQGQDPLVERLEALARLDSDLVTEDLLANLRPRWRGMESGRIFRLLWLAVALSAGRSVSGRRLAREVLAEWNLVASAGAPLSTLAICGLCIFVLGEESDALQPVEFVPLSDLAAPTAETAPPTSPQLTVCQVLALARSVSAPATPGYPSLAWLVDQVAEPSSSYHRSWHRMVVSQRRFALEILRSAQDALASGDLAFLAETLALGIVTPEQDDIWDEHLAIRLEAARLGAGSATAAQLLDRRCDAWIDIIQTRILRADRPLRDGAVDAVLRLLERAVDLAMSQGDAARRSARKLIDAVMLQLGTLRQEQLTLLLGRLEHA